MRFLRNPSRREKRHTDTFTAVNEDGMKVEVFQLTTFIETTTLESRHWRAGLSELVLADGSHVNRLSEGKFQVVASGEVLTTTL